MAFQLPNAAPVAAVDDNSWKNDGFINIYLPTSDGKKKKIGSIGLKLRKAAEKELIDFLQADPSNITLLFQNAEVDFQLVDGSTGSSFALPTAS